MIWKPLGKIEQFVDRKEPKPLYQVSFFGNKWKQVFKDFQDAKNYAEIHARSIIADKQIRSVAIEFKRLNGRKSYIIYNSYLAVETYGTTAVEYEESAYDYYSNLFFRKKYWLKAKQVNEAKYNNDDLIRASLATSKPAVIFNVAAFATLIIIVTVMFFTLIMEIANKVKEKEWPLHVAIYIGIGLSVVSLIVFILEKQRVLRTIRENYNTLNQLNWRMHYHKHKKSFLWQFFLSFCLFAVSMLLTIYLWNQKTFRTFSFSNMHVFFIFLDVLSLLIISVSVFSFVSLFFTLSYHLSELYTADEVGKFKEWLHGYSTENDFRTTANFFGIPIQTSAPEIELERKITIEFVARDARDEIENYLKRTKKHTKVAKKRYIQIMKGDFSEHNISENN